MYVFVSPNWWFPAPNNGYDFGWLVALPDQPSGLIVGYPLSLTILKCPITLL